MKRAILAAALALSAACACSHPSPAPGAARTAPGATSTATAGAAGPARYLGYAGPDLAGFSAATGTHPDMAAEYLQPGDPFTAPAAGVTPFASLATTASPAQVLAGAQDKALAVIGREIAAYGKPVAVSIDPEGNGPWYSYGTAKATPAQYVAVYRHVRAVLLAAGAKNAVWTWTVSNSPPITHTPLLQSLYPGDAYVDWIGVDGYFIGSENSWQQVFARVFSRVRSFTGKPFLITETSVQAGKYAADWVYDLFSGLKSTPGVLGLIWFDYNKAAENRDDWRIEDDPAARDAFRAAVKEYGQ